MMPSEQTLPAQLPAQPNPVKLLLTVKETCTALGLGRTSVHSLLATGQLFSVKAGGRRLVPMAALCAFVERLTAVQQQKAS
jgi:excisionase family DNA binding protein